VLSRLKALLDDFSGLNVEAAASLVENAGRFLLRLPGALGVGWLCFAVGLRSLSHTHPNTTVT
jgi:hypothetical protein